MSKATAFVHCRIMPGGALNAFKQLIQEADTSHGEVFTLFSDRKILKTEAHSYKVVTALPAWINAFFLRWSKHKVPVLSQLFDYRNLMPFYPCLMRRLSRKITYYAPQKLLISSFAVAKNLEFCKKNYHGQSSIENCTLYLHSPMQYIRSHHEEYLQKLSGYKKQLFRWISPKLRKWDLQFTRFDTIYANSSYTAQLAQELYGLEAQVKYPYIAKNFFTSRSAEEIDAYYIYTGRLTTLVKELDRIIRLFNTNKQPLLIMGSGPDEKTLKQLAGPNILFLGRIEDPEEKKVLIQKAKGYINISKESFGISTAEALLLGVPVLGYAEGATAELVDSHSGILVADKKPDTLVKAFEAFHTQEFDRKYIAQHIRSLLQKNT